MAPSTKELQNRAYLATEASVEALNLLSLHIEERALNTPVPDNTVDVDMSFDLTQAHHARIAFTLLKRARMRQIRSRQPPWDGPCGT